MNPHRTRWWTTIAIYAFFGFALGLADGEFGRAARDLGVRHGMATALSVNVLLPLIAVSLAFIRPSYRMAWLGTIAMTIAFIAGLAVLYPPAGGPAALVRSIPPVIVTAGLGYLALGTLAVFARRRFGKPLEPS